MRDEVGDYRALAYGDIGKGAGVDKYRLALDRLKQVRIEGIEHPGGHCAIDFEVGGCYVIAPAVFGDDHFRDSAAKIPEVFRNRQYCHNLAGNGYLETGIHFEAVVFAAQTDSDIAKRLGAKVNRPADLYGVGVDIEPAKVSFGQPLVVIIFFVLHSGGQRNHTKIVRIGDGVDIAGEAD